MALDREALARYGFLQKETVDVQKKRIRNCSLEMIEKEKIIN
jgi:hypothetical protein